MDGAITSVRGDRDQCQDPEYMEAAADSRQALLGSVQPRCDFAETAFFLPTLRTDAQGRVSFRGFRGDYTISAINADGNGLSSWTFSLK